MRSFDRKFGEEFLATVPQSPGVYRVFDRAGALVYVGKAKNLRRRLGQYRNAKRRKKHLKMRAIVGDADRIEIESCLSELEACLLEARLIQTLRPKWNVAGAFYFLYPMVGIADKNGESHFCYTTRPETVSAYRFHGAYRSRFITGEAFFSLMKLLAFVGHPVRKKRWLRIKGVYEFAFRQVPERWLPHAERFFRGESEQAIEELILLLLENAGARKARKAIQEHIDNLNRFYRHEALRLRHVRERTGFEVYPVPQIERDVLFLRDRYGIETY